MENNLPTELPEVFSEESFNSLSILEKALYYSRVHNLGVLPIKNSIKDENGKRKPNKEPKDMISWLPYKTQKPTEEEIKKWFGGGNVNIAILAGKIYSIVVLDIDCHSPGYDGSFIQTHEIPETWKSKTGRGGYHYYFRYPIGIKVDSAKMKDKGLEFMSDGSYLVEAGSKYIDGDKVFEYTWEPGHGPWDMEVAEMPQWLIDLVKVPTGKTIEILAPKRTKKEWEIFKNEVQTEGGRHTALTSFSGHIFATTDEDKWETESIPELIKYNSEKLSPPLSDKEAMSTIKGIMGREKRKREKRSELGELESTSTEDEAKNQMSILYEELSDTIELVIDQDGHCYIVDLESPQRKLYEEGSTELIDFILVAYEKKFKRFTNKELAKNLSINMRAQAGRYGKRVTTHVRIAYVENENALYYDLNNSSGEVVKITEDNIEVTNIHNLYFKRLHTMGEQAKPEEGDSDFDIWYFFNISIEKRKLFLCYLISLFMPNIRIPMLAMKGEKGSGKTTCIRVVKALVDPGLTFHSATISSPKDIRDLQLQLSEGYFLAYDNLSTVKGDMSDILCEAITGGGFKNRILYANKEMMTLPYSTRIAIGSINNVLWNDDIIDRAIMIDVPKIEGERDFDEKDFEEKFYKCRPQILYSIFCILGKSLGNRDKIVGLPRMSGFAKQGEKVSRGLGNPDNDFLELYKKHIEYQRSRVKLEIIPEFLLILIEHILQMSNTWTDTPTKLFSIAQGLHIISMPKELVSFCRSLYNNADNFESLGIQITKSHSGDRSVTIQRILDTSDTSDTGNQKTGEDPTTESPSGSEEKSIE